MLFEFEIDGHPVSANNAFPTSRSGHRFMSKEYKSFQTKVQVLLKDQRKIRDYGPLSVEIDLYAEDWFTKSNTVRKKDLANFEKTLVDTVFKILGMEDCYIFSLTMRKLIGKSKKTVLRAFDLSVC